MTDQARGLIDAQGQRHARAEGSVRIVSLVPSITELLCALGLVESLVGRTGFCVHPRDLVRGIPKLGGTKDVDLEALFALVPTHVVVNIDENTRDTYLKLRERVPHVIVTHPNTPEDNLDLYRLVGGIFGRDAEAMRLCEAFSLAEARLEHAASGLAPRRVLYLIWRRPWMTVARDTYISAMLRRIRWFTVPVVTSSRYPELTDLELGEVGAELCLLSSEPYAFRARHIEEVRDLLGTRSSVRLIDGEMISWYGSRAILAFDYLARFAHDVSAHAA